jgi:hypothetical protein
MKKVLVVILLGIGGLGLLWLLFIAAKTYNYLSAPNAFEGAGGKPVVLKNFPPQLLGSLFFRLLTQPMVFFRTFAAQFKDALP